MDEDGRAGPAEAPPPEPEPLARLRPGSAPPRPAPRLLPPLCSSGSRDGERPRGPGVSRLAHFFLFLFFFAATEGSSRAFGLRKMGVCPSTPLLAGEAGLCTPAPSPPCRFPHAGPPLSRSPSLHFRSQPEVVLGKGNAFTEATLLVRLGGPGSMVRPRRTWFYYACGLACGCGE